MKVNRTYTKEELERLQAESRMRHGIFEQPKTIKETIRKPEFRLKKGGVNWEKLSEYFRNKYKKTG